MDKMTVLPIGDAVLGLQGGMLRAKQALKMDNILHIQEERQILLQRIKECKTSVLEENYPSTQRHFLKKHAPNLINEAEDLLQTLSARLTSRIRLISVDFPNLVGDNKDTRGNI
jgi:hypothetical protein